MLTLTESAATVIRSLTEQDEVPDGAGLRIASDPDGDEPGTLTLALAPTPQEGDQVLDAEGARLFLESTAAATLEDKALDADVDDQGGVTFQLAEQASNES